MSFALWPVTPTLAQLAVFGQHHCKWAAVTSEVDASIRRTQQAYGAELAGLRAKHGIVTLAGR